MAEHNAGVNLIGTLALKIHDLQMDAAVTASGMSSTSCACLVSLAHQDTTQTIGDIAKICNLSHSATARLVGKLETLGYLCKATHQCDLRKTHIKLTNNGYEMRDKILNARRLAIEPFLSKFSSSDWKAVELAAGIILADMTESRLESEQICRLCDTNACGGADCPVEKKALILEHNGMI